MPLTHAKLVTFINTADRMGSAAFYRDVLHLQFIADDGFALVFDLCGAVLRVNEVQGFVASQHTVLGWSVDDIETTMEHLVSAGVTPVFHQGFGQDELGIWSSADRTVHVAWFHDPDGNVLSVVQGG